MRKRIAQTAHLFPSSLQRGVALVLDENALPNTMHHHFPGMFISHSLMPFLSEIGRVFPIVTVPVVGLLVILSTAASHEALGLDKLETVLIKFCRHVLLESFCSTLCQHLFQATTGSLPTPEIQENLDMLAVIMTHFLEESYRMNTCEKWQNNSWSFSGVGMSVSRVLVESALHKYGENLLDQSILKPVSLEDILTIGADFGLVTGLYIVNSSVFQLLGIGETDRNLTGDAR